MSVFLAVFIVVFASGAIITFILPDTFVASTRVYTAALAEADFFQSETVLARAVETLGLREKFANKYREARPLPKERSVEILRRSLRVKPLGTNLVEIRAYSANAEEAAMLANGVTDAGLALLKTGTGASSAGSRMPAVIENAVVPTKPARPNRPLNLALGALVGIILGVMAGGVGARLAVGFDRGNRVYSMSA